jgi:hypothetical protein
VKEALKDLTEVLKQLSAARRRGSRERLYGARVERATWEAVLRILDGGSP